MTKFAKAAGFAGILVLASTVVAWRPQGAEPGGALGEGQAAVTDLGANASAITYWVSKPDGLHVVTLSTSCSTGTAVRSGTRSYASPRRCCPASRN